MELASSCPDIHIKALCRPQSKIGKKYPNVEFDFLDLTNKQLLRERTLAYKPTCVLHCAATGMTFPKAEWFELIRFNVNFSIELCECAAQVTGCHFIFIGTGLAYKEQGRPLREDDALDTLHPYGASKAAADLLVRSAAAEFKVPTTIIRPFSFTGIGDDRTRLFASILRAASEKRHMDLSECTQIRDHCSAQDLAKGLIACIRKGPTRKGFDVFNLGSGQTIRLRTLIEEIVAELNLPVELRFGVKHLHRFEPMHLVADISHAKEVLGWTPQQRLVHAIWQLAGESFPELNLREPKQ